MSERGMEAHYKHARRVVPTRLACSRARNGEEVAASVALHVRRFILAGVTAVNQVVKHVLVLVSLHQVQCTQKMQ